MEKVLLGQGVFSFLINNHIWKFYHLLAIRNNAVMNIGIYISVTVWTFSIPGCISKSRIVGSYDNLKFNFLRKCQNVFHSRCTILHSHQQCTGFHFLHILANIVFHTKKKKIVILVGVKWHLMVAWICFPLLTSDVIYCIFNWFVWLASLCFPNKL